MANVAAVVTPVKDLLFRQLTEHGIRCAAGRASCRATVMRVLRATSQRGMQCLGISASP